ncbi:hypothetical protein P170DRAFT_368349 [Aspergillus steynii IBT 23096]|uniref:Alpha/beta-hydrolase n=1 Tax=Aspergillus steynii IBT 23096 TaxID=1392250 RepID=A0A2I2FUJ9_9EURO|nr:uncharacterized protein P170DRAFT_368349 [Aspergillus steynii IBT 23096]PLB44325.1 hypothetical protein P170DRAFT_368349 [Aspergillus steynii IBT 23096]
MHAEEDYLSFSACTELPKRGYTAFCANNDASKSGYMTDLDFEEMMLNVGEGMSYLRNQTEFDKVVILGHSGGGAMMAAYQNIAENGVQACQGAEKIYPCSNQLAGLKPADGLMLLDCNYGLSTMSLLSLNPAIEDESTGSKINQSLNLYSPANGYTSNGANYSAAFQKTFQTGVVARNNRILDHALSRLDAIEAGNGTFSDDEPLFIPDASYIGFNNKFFSQDTRFLAHTTHAWPLLHKNGSTTTQIIPSFLDGAIKTTVKRYLSTLAIRVTSDFAYRVDGFDGIDYASSQTAPLASIRGVRVPLLTMGMTGHWEYLNAEKLHLNAPGNDTSIAFVEGAQHTIDTCTECESYPGEFGDTMVTAYDFVGGWLEKKGRFL